jgi:TIR domain/Protein of unknown function (DUF3592)
MPGVFISYRRDDSAGFAGALERELANCLGPERVFMDIKDIEGGADFPVAIEEAIESSEVALILIGSRWLDAKDAQGLRRLEKPDDFVRQEVARALQTKARVIPLLLDGAQLPAAEQLPQDLQPLTTREALELRNSHWEEDFTRLLNSIREGMCTLDIQEAADKKIGKDFDPVAPRNVTLNLMVYAPLVLGVIFVIVALGFVISQARFLARARKADAHVVAFLREPMHTGSGEAEIDRGEDYVYRPQLEYTTPAGQTARITLSTATNPPGYYIGEPVPILFDPKDPADGIPDTFWGRWLFAIVFGGVGVVACVAGAILLAVLSRRRRRKQRLLKEGRPVITAYHSVEQNTAMEVNGRHPFHLITEWRNPVSHELVQFRSPALWEDPSPKVGERMITVIVDPNNFHHYVMDLSFLYGGPPKMRRL